MAGAFSGLLAFAIEKMDGVAGLGSWRWIFILEGIVTVVIGLSLQWTLPDSPETASFLTAGEKDFIIRRLRQDAVTSAGQVRTNDGFQWRYLRAAMSDWKVYFAVIIYWGVRIPRPRPRKTAPFERESYAFFYKFLRQFAELHLPIRLHLLRANDHSRSRLHRCKRPITHYPDLRRRRVQYDLLLRARRPTPNAVAFHRYSIYIAVIGFIGLLAIPHPKLPGLTYAFLFTIPGGVYPPLIGCLSWVGNNLAPTWKRAVGMAVLISIGNLGGAIGSNIFIARQAPHYWLGYGLALGMVTAAIISTFVLRIAYGMLNKKRDQMSEEEIRAKYTEEELLDLGDKSPLYRYVI
ncbi:hypothetical protein LTS15_001455 [Exophiala xenobiotica]|nr:hypothetical protein LTS15_001455 [Exophiala xenobiotica]